MKAVIILLTIFSCALLAAGRDEGGPDGSSGGPGAPGGSAESESGSSNGTVIPIKTSNDDNRPGNDASGGRNQTTPPRGDDPRSRNWGAMNGRNETEFDDPKSPRKIAFLGKSANVRIYPNYSDTSVFLQLRFGRIMELDGEGRPVPNHRIASLAEASDTVTFNANNRTIGNVNVSYVNVTVRPEARDEFRPMCGIASGSNMPSAPPADLAPRLSVELLFGLDDALTLPYGGTNLTVPRNGLKYSIAYTNWPFCNDTHALAFSLDLLLPANATSEVTTSGGLTTLTLRLGTEYNASLSFLDYALDGPNGSIKLPSNVTVLPKAQNASGTVLTVNTVLPNPRSRGAAGVWYDPTSATTSVYLSSTDPGNGNIAVTSSGNTTNTTTTGAAAGLRVTFWAALAAIMLSAFMMS